MEVLVISSDSFGKARLKSTRPDSPSRGAELETGRSCQMDGKLSSQLEGALLIARPGSLWRPRNSRSAHQCNRAKSPALDHESACLVKRIPFGARKRGRQSMGEAVRHPLHSALPSELELYKFAISSSI